MLKSTTILSDIIVFMKYARYDSKLKRRETWEEIVDRNKKMHITKYPSLVEEIEDTYKYVYEKKVLPSMRGLQFGGKAIQKNPIRQYNCSAIAMSSVDAFKELAFLLMCGTGVGYSVQQHHVEQLPEIYKPNKERRFLIADSIEGWADAIGALVESYMGRRKAYPRFDFSDIRAKGELLKTSGGTAPGPEPLKDCLHNIKRILDRKASGTKLSPIEVHDICCFIADCVVVGGTRRSSCIALFSFTDTEMLECKFEKWFEENPQRARANNSAVILRHKIKEEEFLNFFEKVRLSNSGEPGWIFSNDSEQLCNPCQPEWATVIGIDGITTIGDIKVGDLIYTEEGYRTVICKGCTGVKDVYEYKTSSGTFVGTDTHNLISNGKKVEAKNCKNIDILSGLSPYSGDDTIHELNPQIIMDGLIIGDGCVHKASNNLVFLYIGENDKDYFQSEISHLILKDRSRAFKNGYEVKTTLDYMDVGRTYDRKVPDKYFYKTSIINTLSFLRGLYSANGSVCGNRITLKASSKKLIEQVQQLLSYIGIKSYITTNKRAKVKHKDGTYESRESYDLNISSDRDKFKRYIGFIQKYKMGKIKIVRTSCRSTAKIQQVKKVSTEKVYSITVDSEKHTYWTGGLNVSNCAEVSLRIDKVSGTGQMCNLVEINGSDISTQEEFNNRAKAAAFIATLQAGYTDFHYLRDTWKEITERESLIGVGITGIASSELLALDFKEAANVVLEENERVSSLIDINKAARTTVVKPSGTSSLVLGCSSGIHSWHASFYIRRMRVGKDEPIYKYLLEKHPELLEDDFFKPTTQAIISVPIKAPEGAITRTETALQFLERVKKLYKNWIIPGHRDGHNTNNISATVYIKEHEWDKVANWLWENRNNYTAISVLPYDNHTYVQPPFEEINEEEYKVLVEGLKDINLAGIIEEKDNTVLQKEVACSGNSCEVV
ncbi:hypothetical protein M0R04_05695 [Candidatus Dojkabacteria bacterium]|jgi:hypothetical protein|nr:hypothetical protein [Candidatus Dojkabacteria bacterium]